MNSLKNDLFGVNAGKCPPPPSVPVTVADMRRSAATPDEAAEQALRYEREVLELLSDCHATRTLPDMAFTGCSPCTRTPAVYDPAALPPDLWYLGDLHGDAAALMAAVEYVDGRSATPPTIVFMGDAFDRARHGYETLLALFHLIASRPGRVLYLAGNHEAELHFRPRFELFYPGAIPAEFCDWLNRESLKRKEIVGLGRLFVSLFAKLPHALFLPDGSMVAHAGVPHVDVQRQMHSASDLDTPAARSDFLWGRFAPDRARCACERKRKTIRLGCDDLRDFCATAERLLELPVRRLIHGHEHPAAQWEVYPIYREIPVLTLNTCRSFAADPPITAVAVGRHRPDDLPEVHLLELGSPDIS